ncbi:MAG: C45 family peptidase, partial [Bdellovibrionota bacterium]
MNFDYRQLKGTHFLRLNGSHTERAKMHGQILKSPIQNGALPALAKKNEWIIRRAGGAFAWKPLQNVAVNFYHHLLLPLMAKSLLPRDRELILALAEAAEIPYKTILRALFQADGLMLLSRLSIMKYLFKDFPAQELPGCSSAVVHPCLTQAGKMLVSRNQDYPVTGPWERESTVIFHQPTEAGEIPHVSVVSAGLHTAGLTSMNQEGLTVAAHAHFGRDVSIRGMPVFVLGGLIASQAKNLGEAVDIVRRHNRYANWTFVVSSAKEQNAMAVEMGPKKMATRFLDEGLLTHTNFF